MATGNFSIADRSYGGGLYRGYRKLGGYVRAIG